MKKSIVYNKKVFVSAFLILLSTHSYIFAQQTLEPENDFWQNVRFGGSVGLSFSNGFFNGSLAPKAIYDFNQYTSAGVGIAGSYTSASNYDAYTLAGSAIGLFRPMPALQLSAEFEQSYVSRSWGIHSANNDNSYWYPALFLGIGYTTGPVTAGVRYDVLYNDEKSIYGNAFMPFVSVYF